MSRGEIQTRLGSVVLVCCLLLASLVLSIEARATMIRAIDNTHPVYDIEYWPGFVSGDPATQIQKVRDALPVELRPYTVITLWYFPDWGSLQTYRDLATACENLGMDYMLGFCDPGNGVYYNNDYPTCTTKPETYYQMALSEIETNYRNASHPHFIGVEVAESAQLPGGVKAYEDNYLVDLINSMAAEAPHGRYVIWKDGAVACNDMGKTQPFIYAQQSVNLRNAIQNHPNNVILVTKYSSYHQHYLTDENAMGWWLSGLTAGWGVNFENFWWSLMGYGPLVAENHHAPGYYQGQGWHQLATQSDGLAGQKFLDAAAAGAVYFGLEWADYPIWGAKSTPSQITPVLNKVVAPFMTKVAEASNPWIPDKNSVLNKVKVVYQATDPNASELDIYPDASYPCTAEIGAGQELFRHLYGTRLTNKMMINSADPSLGLHRAPKHILATTGKFYFLPVLPYISPTVPSLTPFSNVLNDSNWATYCSSPSLKMTYFTNKYLPEYTGDIFAVRFNDKWLLNNPRENTELADGAKFTLNLQTATAKQLSGIFPQGTFALVDEQVGADADKIQIRVNNYRQLANDPALYPPPSGWDTTWYDDPTTCTVPPPSCDNPNPACSPPPDEDWNKFEDYMTNIYTVPSQMAAREISVRRTTFIVKGVTSTPSCTATGVSGYTGFSKTENWNAGAGEYTIYLDHNGPVDLAITAPGNSSRASVPNPSAPVGWWKLNSNTNDDGAYGLANNGTRVGNPGYVTGKLGKALSFPTNGQKMTTDDSRYYSVHTNFTMSLWVKPATSISNFASLTEANTGINPYLGSQRMAVYPIQGAALYSSDYEATAGLSVGTNGIAVFEHSSNYAPCILKQATTLPSNQWTQIVVVYENNTPRLYKNGVKFTDASPLQSTKIAHPGAQLAGNDWGAQYTGGVDDYRIYDRVLNDAEIKALYSFPSETIENMVTFESVADTAPVNGWQDSPSPYGIDFGADLWAVWVSTGYGLPGPGECALMNNTSRTITLPAGKKLKRVDLGKCCHPTLGCPVGTITFHSSTAGNTDRVVQISSIPLLGYQFNWSNPAGSVTITANVTNGLCAGSVLAFDNFVFSD